ncbi:hypothetical protein E8E12_011284 [Didymella heteroderae]|uniref:Uncharacterized protein n=1 Tax=Didymella heteroderae TaxID=1769908 RepID=A0A9P5C4K6_9PLEO|nr:hypothetical protein E8E12_011284 [Didymella heteroderae]
MERPVRSLKSIIHETPGTSDKSSPAVPAKPPLLKYPSCSSTATVQTRSVRLSLWEPPANWENGEDTQAQQPTTSFTLRQYSPLLPEPPEDIAAMQADPLLWQQSIGFPQTGLEPIHERAAAKPVIPPRNPSRLSPSMPNPGSTRKDSKDVLPSISSRYSTNTNDIDGPSWRHFHGADLPSPLEFASALSDMTVKQRAFNSPDLGSTRDSESLWGGPHLRAYSAKLDGNPYPHTQVDRLNVFRKGSIMADDSHVSPEETETSDKMQALSFAQDYHNVFADQSFDDYDELEPSGAPPKDRELTPQPLAWNKGGDTPPVECHQRPHLPPTTLSGRYKNIRKMSSWVNHRLRKESQIDVGQRSSSDPTILSNTWPPESEIDQHLKHDARLANIVQHGKDLLSRRILRKDPGERKPLVISLPPSQRFEQTSQDSSMHTAPFEMATPVFRLPGGLSLVRQSPLSAPRPQTAGESSLSPFSDFSWSDFPVSSPFRRDFSRRSSCQSATSQQQSNNPFAAMRYKFSSSTGSSLVMRSFSYSTTSLASPQPQEAFSSSYTPPQPRRRSHNVGSPLTAPPSSHCNVVVEQSTNINEPTASKLNLFEKAKNARDAWKKQQRDAKNEKIKQSIRLVGPADARDVAGYIKCSVEGRQSGDSGIGEGKLLGQMVKEVS